jgi:hypothetical protein
MSPEEYAAFRVAMVPDPVIRVEDVGGPDRTLLYGYDVERLTWHVYLEGGEIHLVRLNRNSRVTHHEHGESLPAHWLAPNKRAYPERTDLQFATVMAARGVDICFTTFNTERWAETRDDRFHGVRA